MDNESEEQEFRELTAANAVTLGLLAAKAGLPKVYKANPDRMKNLLAEAAEDFAGWTMEYDPDEEVDTEPLFKRVINDMGVDAANIISGQAYILTAEDVWPDL